MGAGRVVYQELTRMTKSIQDGDFFRIPEFLTAVENCKKHDPLCTCSDRCPTAVFTAIYRHLRLLELAEERTGKGIRSRRPGRP